MGCKGCLQSVIVSDEYIQQLVKEQLQLETDLVDDQTYHKRLQICKNCPSFFYGNTCSHCGCFVQFRAKLSYKTCPFPNGSKW
ncbi:DUF6171 family protein [Oceanobacillus sp. Castelsardo]|uniref:DUF6171 family protein n=1 Tax=Oceanobacillus sp. Castelsardo TaxID=1851204 RepID=UPI0009EE5316|nr:DUF6171 family protein [Oceanobacillus sp. Castelsardo]